MLIALGVCFCRIKVHLFHSGTLKKTHEAHLLLGKLQLNPYLRLAVDPSLSQDLKGKELLPSYIKFLDAQFHFLRQ
jgi:hypothetical protein